MFIIGVLAGILGGLGLGGGTLLIPMLSLVTKHDHFTLQLYNLIFFFPTGFVALYFHSKNGLVNKEVSKSVILIAFFGAVIGSQLSLNITDDILKRLFGAFILIIGVYQLKSAKRKNY